MIFGSLAGAVFALGTNNSFEDGTDPGSFLTLGTNSTDITDWTVRSGTIDYIGTYWTASDGNRSIDMTGDTAGTISQDIATTVGVPYEVTFDLSGNPAGAPNLKVLTVSATDADSQDYSFDTGVVGNTLVDMMWKNHTYTFTATAAITTLTFASQTDGYYGPALDNVVISQVLPGNMNQCKKGGWETFGVFKNQGDCVSYVATGGKNLPAN